MMKYTFKLLVGMVFVAGLVTSCQNRKADYSEFSQFYKKFMQDSLFQLQHISFPLAGLPDNAIAYGDSLQNFRWTKENWRMHKPIDFAKSKFEQNFQTLGDELIIENLVEPTAGYGMVRRWAKIGGEWSLIYYGGLNPIQQ